MPSWKVLLVGVIATVTLAVFLPGCDNEKNNPLGTETVGTPTTSQETFGMDLDARGFVNGSFMPNDRFSPYIYPVHYEGAWNLVPVNVPATYYMMTSAATGSTMTVTATATRIIFEFYDYEMYAGAGSVQFALNGAPQGTFSLARRSSTGDKILQYMVMSDGHTLASATMTLLSGRVVVTGVYLVYADQQLPRRAMANRLPPEFRSGADALPPRFDPVEAAFQLATVTGTAVTPIDATGPTRVSRRRAPHGRSSASD